MDEAVSQLDVQIEAERGIGVATDRAISSALIGCSLVIISVAFLKQKASSVRHIADARHCAKFFAR